MKKFYIYFIVTVITLSASSFSIVPKEKPPNSVKPSVDSVLNADNAGGLNKSAGISDSAEKIQQNQQTNSQNAGQNNLQIDTALNKTPLQTVVPVDTVNKIDSAQIKEISENTLTNTRLFIYILLSVIGLALFFYIFVITLFKTFHKKKSTRQSLLLSWNLFFIVTIIWIFIIWGLVAGFWTVASFMIVVIFLFIISLIMTIIAIKSR